MQNGVKFDEPVFYHNGDDSTFLDAAELSLKGIKLSMASQQPSREEIFVEFSFPGSDYIVKAKAAITVTDDTKFLKFISIEGDGLKRIRSFLRKKSASLEQPSFL